MMISQHLSVAELAAVIDAGVILPVADDIVAAADQCADDAKIRLETGGEGHGAVLMDEIRQLRLQLQMHLQGSVEETGSGAAGAVLLKSLDTGLHDGGLHRQAQVVVGTEHDAAFAFHEDLHILPGFQRVEIGIDAHCTVVVCQGKFFAFFKKIHSIPLSQTVALNTRPTWIFDRNDSYVSISCESILSRKTICPN